MNESRAIFLYIFSLLDIFAGWCQLLTYLRYVWRFLSVWYVVSFTIERYIAGKYHPLTLRIDCYKYTCT